jgi:hypothetical protein
MRQSRKDIETDRQADRQTGRQADRQTGRQADSGVLPCRIDGVGECAYSKKIVIRR